MKKLILSLTLFCALSLSSAAALAGGPKPPNPNTPAPQEEAPKPAPVVQKDCIEMFCVGDTVIETYNNRWAIISGINQTNNLIFLSSAAGSTNYGEWHIDHLSWTHPGSCVLNGKLCINDAVIETYNNRWAKVAGFKKDGSVVLSATSGSTLYGAWSHSHLAYTRSGECEGNFCIGDIVNESYNNRVAKIVGFPLTEKNQVVISAESGSTLYGSWSYNYISLRQRSEEVLRRKAQQEQLAREKAELDKLVSDGIADEETYRFARSSGSSHSDALDAASGPAWLGLASTEKFVRKLSRTVYNFDAQYLQKVAALLLKDKNAGRSQLFVSMALLPYLKDFGYSGTKEKYIQPSIKRMEAFLAEQQLGDFGSIESTIFSRRMALQMLAASLQTGMVQMDAGQKERANQFLRIIGDSLAGSMRIIDMRSFFDMIPEYQRLLLELSQNPYLRARSATDMGLLNHVRNS